MEKEIEEEKERETHVQIASYSILRNVSHM